MFPGTVHTLLWHSPFLFSFWSVTGTAVLNTPSVPNSISQLQYITNSTLSSIIPGSFNATIQEPRGSKLPSILCLQIAVYVIGDYLALEDFTGRIPAQGWSQSSIVISVSTQGSTVNSIERRFVIWGIFCALSAMVGERNFRSAIVRLEWRGLLVGSVAVYREGLAEVGTGNNSTNMTQLAFPLLCNGTSSNDAALYVPGELGEPVLKVAVSKFGPPWQPLDKYGIFINLLGALVYAAEHSENEIIREVYTTSVGYGVQVIVSAESSPTPRSRPPFLTYKWIIRTVTLTPGLLAPTELSDAFELAMLVDEVLIGRIMVKPFGPVVASASSGSLLQDKVDVSTA